MVAKDIFLLQPWLMVEKRKISWNFKIISTFLWNFPKSSVQNAIFMGKSHEISFFAIVSHGCIGKNIFGNHDWWFQRILFPLKPWLTLAKRLSSCDFPNVYLKMSWLLKTWIYLWIRQKKQFHFALYKVDSQNSKFNLKYNKYGCIVIYNLCHDEASDLG